MTEHPCPSCGKKGFTWIIVDDSDLTKWGCKRCGYQAEEDEANIKTCPKCNAEESFIELQDPEETYYYCLACKYKES